MRSRLFASAALVLLLGAGAAAGADDDLAPLEGLIAPEGEVHDAAVTAWEALPAEVRARAVRVGLRSERRELALAAAVVASPWWLDGEELGFQSKALELDPLARLIPPQGLKAVADDTLVLGSRDLPALWAALAERDPPEEQVGYSRLHRCLLHEQLPALVPLLATAKPGAFRALLWDVMNQAQGEADDDRHALYVRAFRHALARLEAEAKKSPVPSFDEIPPPAPRAGLPEELMQLARATWGANGEGFDAADYPQHPRSGGTDGGYVHRFGPSFWLARWARRLVAVEDDVERLLELTQLPHAPDSVRQWAGRQAGRFEGRAAGRVLAQILQEGAGDVAALAAAAQAAALGRVEDWKELSGAVRGKSFEERQGDVELLRWIAEPTAALEAAWAELARGELPGALEPFQRGFNVYDGGIEIPAAALAELAARLRKGGAPPATELTFFARVMPEVMTVADAQRIVERWGKAQAPDHVRVQDLLNDLAALEVRAPAELAALLRRWSAEHPDLEVRADLLALLARLGDTQSVEPMLAVWSSWRTPGALGRVKDPRVEAFLKERLADPDPEVEAEALEALAVFHGCPEPLAAFLGPSSRDDGDPGRWSWAEAKALVLAGDPIGAALARTVGGPEVGAGSLEWTAGFALSRDPRVTERMVAWRAARGSGLYWPATAVLAVRGDPAAREEWGAFLRAARTFLLDDLQDSMLFTFDGDPGWVRLWIERLAENCCLSWHAGEVLAPLFPTAPWEQAAGDGGRACAMARAWFSLHGAHLRRSHLVDGWVPGPR